MNIMKRLLSKKVVAVGLAAGITLGIGGAAFAYFTSTGSGSGSALTGSPSQWTVAATSSTGTMYPGVGFASLDFSVTNNSTGAQAIESESAAVAQAANGDIVTTAGNDATAVPGCLASWYFINNQGTLSVPLKTSIGHLGAFAVTGVQVGMFNDLTTSQNACAGFSPAITLTVG